MSSVGTGMASRETFGGCQVDPWEGHESWQGQMQGPAPELWQFPGPVNGGRCMCGKQPWEKGHGDTDGWKAV